ncbi:hypothetical protein FMM_00455 [Micrococcus luteus]|nr:hypothetical protein FMM_00455 [Micrococcus luteus]
MFLVEIGAVSSTVVAALPWVQAHDAAPAVRSPRDVAGGPLGVFLAAHLRRAKRRFGLRWILTLALWCLFWVLGLLMGEARPWAGAVTAVGIMTVTVGGAVWELRR